MNAVPQRQRLVVVGNGMAGGRALEELFARALGLYDVTVFGAEPRVNYDRIQLSPVLSGEKQYRDILIHDEAWYEEHGVRLLTGRKVVAIDRVAKTVTADDGTTVPYDKLLLATGSDPFVIPVPGRDLAGVLTYRDMDDVTAMLNAAERGGRAVVIGGGLLGLEAAAGLKTRGMDVTVIHLMPTLMERQLDPAAGHLLQRELERRGIAIRCGANTKAIVGSSKVEAVELEDGAKIAADIVVMAVGIRPNVLLAKVSGITTNRGVVVSDAMVTSDPDIMAVGECVEHRGMCYGLVAPLYEMGKVVAARLAGDDSAEYRGSITSTKLKVTGIDLFSAGDFGEGPDREEIVVRDAARRVYKRLVLKDHKVVGAVLYGETGDGSWFFDLLREGKDIKELRETLIFGRSFAGGTPLDPMVAVAASPDDAEIRGCNGVWKGTVVKSIFETALMGSAQ